MIIFKIRYNNSEDYFKASYDYGVSRKSKVKNKEID